MIYTWKWIYKPNHFIHQGLWRRVVRVTLTNEQGKLCYCQPSAAMLTSMQHFSIFLFPLLPRWAFASQSQFTGGLTFLEVTAKLQAAQKPLTQSKVISNLGYLNVRLIYSRKKSNQVTANHKLYLTYWLSFWWMQLHFNLFYQFLKYNMIPQSVFGWVKVSFSHLGRRAVSGCNDRNFSSTSSRKTRSFLFSCIWNDDTEK